MTDIDITSIIKRLNLNNNAIKIIILYLTNNKYIYETICFSFYKNLLTQYEYNKYKKIIKTYEDLHEMINIKQNNIKYFSIFVDFCYFYSDIKSYIRMLEICNKYKNNKNNNYIIMKNLINVKPYYWKDAIDYINYNNY